MNNNINKAQKLIDCYNKNCPQPNYTCFGPTGPTGPTGPAAATINVGRTTTTGVGTNAEVINRGTQDNVILDFNIPAGATGPQGPIGLTGQRGATGPQGPQGIQGPTGPQGLQGLQGPIGLTGATGPQGNIGPTGPTATY